MIRLLLHPSRHLFQSHYMLLTVPTPIAQAAIHPGIPFSSSPHTTSPFDLRRSTAQLLLLLIIIVIITSQTMRTSLFARSSHSKRGLALWRISWKLELRLHNPSKATTSKAAITKTLTPLWSHCWQGIIMKLKACFTPMGKS